MKTTSIRKFLGLASLASLTLLANAAQAGPGYPGHFQQGPGVEYRQQTGPAPCWGGMNIDQRQRHLQARIEQGLRSGRLTQYEARELFQDLRRSEFLERRFAADGRLSRAEWAELDRVLDRIAGDLRHELRDDDRRGGRPGWGHRGYAWR